ncbi:caspase family protein [Bosea vestrisii]|uniref:caspase family protein n=1 Tax=Bosea vestrisii TaxID=151416 RepID=UPI0024DF44E8|nr:caspase family protein [Bosea vestrisii]WID98826.1 caspase family protein [Bosea vestrisii]
MLLCLSAWCLSASAQSPAFSDNAESIAVVVGNRTYKQTSTVDFAHNDAEAIKAWLTGTLGFLEQNVFLLKDATLGELNQVFGSEANPQGGRLWRSAVEGRSNVFVYYSGHGVPDLATRQPFLLPQDGNPNASESGYAVQTLYRNLELVRQKIGPQRQLIVMIDACFTGETGRKGESLLAVSAPGFTPAKPRTGGGIVKLVATSGTTPANWDESQKLGLFTSRFLMGAAGLARPAGAPETGPLAWSDLQRYLKDTVEAAARRDSGREQVPEIDPASIALPVAQPVPAVARAVAQARDEANWQRAKAAGERSALETYVARCGETCQYRETALALLFDKRRSTEAVSDEQNWVRLGGSGKYEDYLEGCGTVCAYRALAEGYLGRTDASRDPRVQECDELASDPNDPDRREGVKGVKFGRLDTRAAIAACRQAAEAQPEVRRLSYQLGRAYDKAERHKDALAAYDKAAEAGSAAAMNNLGTLHENGQGGKVDLQKAFVFYERAAGTGNAIAMSNVGRMLQYGRGRARDESGALRWYQKAAEAGDAFSIAKLVPAYLEGRPGFPKNPQKGFDLFRQAADKGDPIAMVSMATLIDNGFGSYFPGTNALQMLMKALEKGEAGAAAVSSSDVSDQKLKPDTVRALQRATQKADHYSGAIDGRFNPVFVRALDSYARSLEQER